MVRRVARMVRLWCGAGSAGSMLGSAVHQKRKTQHSMENVENNSQAGKKERYKTGKAEGWNVEGEKRRATRKGVQAVLRII